MIINGLDGYYTVFDTKNRNTELDTLTNKWLSRPRILRIYGMSMGCLEDSTERSESNPGRNLGITDKKRATVSKTVPRHSCSWKTMGAADYQSASMSS